MAGGQRVYASARGHRRSRLRDRCRLLPALVLSGMFETGAPRGECNVLYQDLREFIAQVDDLGALRRIDGADPRFEIGGITEVAAGLPACPALLFDDIKGHKHGFRIFTNATTNVQRAALALGLDPSLRPL